MSVEREMSLAEWCAKLPSQHLVNQELSTLNTQLAALAKQVEKLTKERNAFQDQCIRLKNERAVENGQLAALAEQNEKMREALQELYELLPVGVGIAALSLPDLSSPVRNSIPKEPTLPVFDADSPRFRQVFDEAVQAHNLPGKRKGEGYRSPITQWCFEIAYSVVNRLRLYEK